MVSVDIFDIPKGSVKIIEDYLDDGGDVNLRDNRCGVHEGETLLMTAARLGNIELLELLLERGADVNAQDKSTDTALIYAVRNAPKNVRTKITKSLLERGADADIKGLYETALIYAARMSDNKMAKLLLYKANVNIENCQGDTPLYYATLCGNIKLLKIFLECGAADIFKHKITERRLLKGHLVEYFTNPFRAIEDTPFNFSVNKKEKMRELLKQYGVKE